MDWKKNAQWNFSNLIDDISEYIENMESQHKEEVEELEARIKQLESENKAS